MSPDELNLKTGRVRFWDLDEIDELVPLPDQVAMLKEDLAQVEYPSGVLLDIGWYPEFSSDGVFVICVAWPEEWDQPLFRQSCPTIAALKNAMIKAVVTAEKATHPELL